MHSRVMNFILQPLSIVFYHFAGYILLYVRLVPFNRFIMASTSFTV